MHSHVKASPEAKSTHANKTISLGPGISPYNVVTVQYSLMMRQHNLQQGPRHSNSNRPFQFDLKVMGRFKNFQIGRACPLLAIVKRLKPLAALSGTVYRLASSMSDHTPVLFNVFEDWNEESVVPHLFCFT